MLMRMCICDLFSSQEHTESLVLVLQAAEAARRKAEEELQRVHAKASAAAEQAAAQVAASKALVKSKEAVLAAKSTEVIVQPEIGSCKQDCNVASRHAIAL
jgi:Tfp pilus assembly protein PilX